MGGIRLTLTFLTPMLPDDLDVLTRPLTYVTWNAVATDGHPHDVKTMLAVGSDLAVNVPDETVVAHRESFGDLNAGRIGFEAAKSILAPQRRSCNDWGVICILDLPGGQRFANADPTKKKHLSDSSGAALRKMTSTFRQQDGLAFGGFTA